MATNKDGSEAARDWLTQSGAPRGKQLAEDAGLDPDSKEARNFIRAVQLFLSGRNKTMSDDTLALVAEAASASELAVYGSCILPRDTDPKKWTLADQQPRQIRLDLDPAIAVTEGYVAAYKQALEDTMGEDVLEIMDGDPLIDPADVDWQL